MNRNDCEILLHELIQAYDRMQNMIPLGTSDVEEFYNVLKFYVTTKNQILDLMTEVRYPER